MNTKKTFGSSLKKVRKARGLTQEDFAISSSRTYVSAMERGLKNPTLEKIEALAGTLKVHPLTLLTLTYLPVGKPRGIQSLHEKVLLELEEITSDAGSRRRT
jgi:transcriptional regulator with XRE-family HTH domain